MSSSRLMFPLIKAHFQGDHAGFVKLSKDVALDFESGGKRVMAQDIKNLLDIDAGGTKPAPKVELPDALSSLVEGTMPQTTIEDLVLHEGPASILRRLLREHDSRDALRAHGIPVRRKILLSGPPGTGKTMTAAALAGSLGLPLYLVRLDGLFRSFLGETGQNLRKVFDAMSEHRGVWFLDEIDALAADRGRENDTGEARRVMNSLLQFVENDDSPGLLIGATNYLSLLDEAIFRRFHVGISYEKPSPDHIRGIVERRLSSFDLTGFDWTGITDAAESLSHSDVTEAATDAARIAVLDRDCRIIPEDLLTAIAARFALRPHKKAAVVNAADNR